MAITYAVYKVEPGDYANEPLTAGVAPDLETATKKVEKSFFKDREPEIKLIDEVTANIIVHKPEYAHYKVIILKGE